MHASIFAGIYSSLEPINVNLVFSGFNNQQNVPYIYINRIGTTYEQLDTTLTRMDTQQYVVEVVTKNFREVPSLLTNIEQKLRLKSFNVANRRVLSIHKISEDLTEPTKGIYTGEQVYEVTSQKTFVDKRRTVTGETLQESLYKCYLASDLVGQVSGFCTTAFVSENWNRPYIFIPKYSGQEDLVTTCSYGDRIGFDIALETLSPVVADNILELIDDNFSYSKLQVSGKYFAGIEWLGNNLQEISIGIWRGSVKYEALIHQ